MITDRQVKRLWWALPSGKTLGHVAELASVTIQYCSARHLRLL